jgi:hypothetical protein
VFTPFHKPPYTYPYGRSVDETMTALAKSPLFFSLLFSLPTRQGNNILILRAS